METPPSQRRAYFFLSASNTFLVFGLTQCAHIHAVQITALIRICLVAGRIVSNQAFNNQARTRAAEVKCRHAETLRASSDAALA
jgi:hypothetical protein